MMYKEVRIGDIFDKVETDRIKGKANDFPTSPIDEYRIPLLTAGIENQGLARYARREDCPTLLSNVLSVSANGANSGAVFYQPEDFAVLQDAYAIRVKDYEIPNHCVGLFLACALNKALASTHDWSFKAGWNRIKNDFVSLPFRKEFVPDFDLLSSIFTPPMEEFDMSKIDTSSWKEFTLSELLEIKKVYGKPLKDYSPGEIPYITGAADNNGIVGYVSAPNEAISKGNCISVDPITGRACYQPIDFVGRGFSGASINLLYHADLTEANALYICAAIEKIARPVASYANLFNSNRLASAKISLPVTEKEVPDWEYMQNYIAELEQDRVAELEQDRVAELDAYLKAAGLNDYELSIEDEMILKGYYNETVSFKEFRINELFDIHPTLSYKLTNEELYKAIGNTPVLSNSSVNNGISGYCGLEPTESGNIITFSDTTMGCETIFYQDQPFIGYPHVQGMYPKGFDLDRHRAEYLISVIRKATNKGYDYSNKFRRDIVGETTISMPVNPDGSINWEYIYIYIRTVEKKTIKEVVLWKEAEMKYYKSIACNMKNLN